MLSQENWISPLDRGRKLNVHKTCRRRPGRLLNVLCTFNLHPVSRGSLKIWIFIRKELQNKSSIISKFWCFCIWNRQHVSAVISCECLIHQHGGVSRLTGGYMCIMNCEKEICWKWFRVMDLWVKRKKKKKQKKTKGLVVIKRNDAEMFCSQFIRWFFFCGCLKTYHLN